MQKRHRSTKGTVSNFIYWTKNKNFRAHSANLQVRAKRVLSTVLELSKSVLNLLTVFHDNSHLKESGKMQYKNPHSQYCSQVQC